MKFKFYLKKNKLSTWKCEKQSLFEMEIIESTSSNEINEASTSTVTLRLGKCEVCMVSDAKYTCPKCEVKFCCLKCSRLHKKELECDGTRDRTKFIPRNKFTNLDLSSDYRLLEEIGRHVEVYKKEHKGIYKTKHEILPHHLYRLKKSAIARNTTLKFLPSNFLRHKDNTTRLNFHNDVIFWHIDWIFANVENLKLVEDKVRETEKIGSILQKYFVKQENELLQEKLQYYQALGLAGIKVFLRAEGKAGNKFYELDIDESLKDNLRRKVIIEYPTIFVINKEHCHSYDVIDSDDEDNKMNIDQKTEDGKAVIDRILRRAESEDSIYNSLKNLLFASDHSDLEGE